MSRMPSRIGFVDLETTGVDKDKHAIVEISIILEQDREEVARYSSLTAPHNGALIDKEALQKNGRTEFEIGGFPDPYTVYLDLCNFLNKYDNPFVPEQNYWFCGQNSTFDKDFLYNFFARGRAETEKRTGNAGPSLFNYFHKYILCTYGLATIARAKELLPTKNLQLSTLTDFYKIAHTDKHQAESDNQATRELFWKLVDLLGLDK